jgi:hypothetical protein
MINDLGNPAPLVLADALGVSVRSVYGWRSRGEAPRCPSLVMFWASSWGQSEAVTHAQNGEMWARGQVQALRRELDTLRRQVAYLQRVGRFEAANAPLVNVF